MYTARKETLWERIGNIALDWPIGCSFGMTLGCNPRSYGRVQPLTSSILKDSKVGQECNTTLLVQNGIALNFKAMSIRDTDLLRAVTSIQY